MTGRGNYDARRKRVIQAGEHPKIEIPVTLSTTPSKLEHKSKEPFYIVVTAHNPLDRPITFYTFFNCFFSLREGSYEDIRCTASDKIIETYPRHAAHMRHNHNDLDRELMITVPPNSSFSEKLELYRGSIEAAAIQPGEQYRVSFTYLRMGTLFWTYGTLEDLKGVRLRSWRKPEEDREESDSETDSAEVDAAIKRHGLRKAPTTTGEPPEDFCLVTESSVEFEVV